MSNPKRHDVFEDENCIRVAVRQVFPPNALGIIYVEYKNLSDSNLQFLSQAEFLEKFKWVENFGSTDTHSKLMSQISDEAPLRAADNHKEESPASQASNETAGGQSVEIEAVKSSRVE
jgi:hypothetical protein